MAVMEAEDDKIVLTHPPGGPEDAPCSFPGESVAGRQSLTESTVWMVRETTGLEVVIVRELFSFIQEGTPTGTMYAHAFVARMVGGTLLNNGPEGPVGAYSVAEIPGIIPVRVANQRVLDEYLRQRAG